MDSDEENIADIDETTGQIEVQFKSETGIDPIFLLVAEKNRAKSLVFSYYIPVNITFTALSTVDIAYFFTLVFTCEKRP